MPHDRTGVTPRTDAYRTAVVLNNTFGLAQTARPQGGRAFRRTGDVPRVANQHSPVRLGESTQMTLANGCLLIYFPR